MVLASTYYDLCHEINGLEERIEGLQEERKKWEKVLDRSKPKGLSAIDYASDSVQNDYYPIPTDEIWRRVHEIDNAMEMLVNMQNGKIEEKKKTRERVKGLKGLEYKIASLRMEGLNDKQIGLELGYAHGTIRNKSMKMTK